MPSKSSKSVVLTPRLDAFVDQLVASGRYQNASEVIREGLRLLEREESREEAEQTWWKHQIERGLSEAKQEDFATGSVEEIFADITNELDKNS